MPMGLLKRGVLNTWEGFFLATDNSITDKVSHIDYLAKLNIVAAL